MDERLRFVARLLEGEKMAPLCREFGISRVTGYKIFERCKACGLEGLPDRSRRPYRHANQLPYQVERTILGIKKEHPFWGAPKIRDKLVRQFPMIEPPGDSLWPHLHGKAEDQPEHRLRRPGGGREVEDQVWLVSFHLGFFDQEEGRIPFGPEKVSTMSPD